MNKLGFNVSKRCIVDVLNLTTHRYIGLAVKRKLMEVTTDRRLFATEMFDVDNNSEDSDDDYYYDNSFGTAEANNRPTANTPKRKIDCYTNGKAKKRKYVKETWQTVPDSDSDIEIIIEQGDRSRSHSTDTSYTSRPVSSVSERNIDSELRASTKPLNPHCSSSTSLFNGNRLSAQYRQTASGSRAGSLRCESSSHARSSHGGSPRAGSTHGESVSYATSSSGGSRSRAASGDSNSDRQRDDDIRKRLCSYSDANSASDYNNVGNFQEQEMKEEEQLISRVERDVKVKIRKLRIDLKEEHIVIKRMRGTPKVSLWGSRAKIRRIWAMQKMSGWDDSVKIFDKKNPDLLCPSGCGVSFPCEQSEDFANHVINCSEFVEEPPQIDPIVVLEEPYGGFSPALQLDLESEPEPEPELQQEPPPEYKIQCPRCTSMIEESEMEKHLNNHFPYGCFMCIHRYEIKIGIEDHIINDHATHFMSDLQPMWRKDPPPVPNPAPKVPIPTLHPLSSRLPREYHNKTLVPIQGLAAGPIPQLRPIQLKNLTGSLPAPSIPRITYPPRIAPAAPQKLASHTSNKPGKFFLKDSSGKLRPVFFVDKDNTIVSPIFINGVPTPPPGARAAVGINESSLNDRISAMNSPMVRLAGSISPSCMSIPVQTSPRPSTPVIQQPPLIGLGPSAAQNITSVLSSLQPWPVQPSSGVDSDGAPIASSKPVAPSSRNLASVQPKVDEGIELIDVNDEEVSDNSEDDEPTEDPLAL